MVSTPVSYSVGPGFKSRPEDEVSFRLHTCDSKVAKEINLLDSSASTFSQISHVPAPYRPFT
jgi:hypothetical protein